MAASTGQGHLSHVVNPFSPLEVEAALGRSGSSDAEKGGASLIEGSLFKRRSCGQRARRAAIGLCTGGLVLGLLFACVYFAPTEEPPPPPFTINTTTTNSTRRSQPRRLLREAAVRAATAKKAKAPAVWGEGGEEVGQKEQEEKAAAAVRPSRATARKLAKAVIGASLVGLLLAGRVYFKRSHRAQDDPFSVRQGVVLGSCAWLSALGFIMLIIYCVGGTVGTPLGGDSKAPLDLGLAANGTNTNTNASQGN